MEKVLNSGVGWREYQQKTWGFDAHIRCAHCVQTAIPSSDINHLPSCLIHGIRKAIAKAEGVLNADS